MYRTNSQNQQKQDIPKTGISRKLKNNGLIIEKETIERELVIVPPSLLKHSFLLLKVYNHLGRLEMG